MQKINLECFAGETATFSLVAQTAAHGVRPLTGASVSFRISDPSDRNAAVFTVAGVVTSEASGAYSVTLTPTQTEDLRGDYEFIAYATVGSTVYGIGRGTLRVYDGVKS